MVCLTTPREIEKQSASAEETMREKSEVLTEDSLDKTASAMPNGDQHVPWTQIRRNPGFLLFGILLLGINEHFLRQLAAFSLKNEFSSHILLIPFISGWLLFRNKQWLNRSANGRVIGCLIAATGVAFSIYAIAKENLTEQDYLALRTFALLLIWFGGFLFFYGISSFRSALFPLLFLILLVPIPTGLHQSIVAHLQQGSTEMSAWLFSLTGTPYFREGTYFQLPSLNINIAPQCSGIRSSLALFITMLLAAHLMLKTGWKRVLLVLLAIPLAMLKNAIRITALSLLAIHVDMRIMTKSSLHQEGGILFFLLALLIMMPVLFLLRRSEGPTFP